MESKTKRLKELKDYLDALNVKYIGTPLSESQIAILTKRIASMDVYFRKVQEKSEIDPLKEPEKYLRLLGELDHKMILLVDEVFSDYVVLKPKTPQQVPITIFVSVADESQIQEKLKLSKIKVGKKGLNGHS